MAKINLTLLERKAYSWNPTEYIFLFGTASDYTKSSMFMSDESTTKFVTEAKANKRRWKKI
jgi:hypothetical protein